MSSSDICEGVEQEIIEDIKAVFADATRDAAADRLDHPLLVIQVIKESESLLSGEGYALTPVTAILSTAAIIKLGACLEKPIRVPPAVAVGR